MKYWLPILAFFLLTPTAQAAIAFDTQATAYDGNNVSSVSVNGTATNAGSIAVIGCMAGGNVGDTITGATVGGNAATAINKVSLSATQYINMFYYLNPPTSSTAYVCNQSGSADMQVSVSFYSDAKQSGQPDAHTQSTASGNLTISVNTVADNAWLVSVARNDVCGVPTAGTGTTIRNSGPRLFATGDSNGAKTPAGSHSMAWNCGSGGTTGAVLASIAPSVAVVAAPKSTLGLVRAFWIN